MATVESMKEKYELTDEDRKNFTMNLDEDDKEKVNELDDFIENDAEMQKMLNPDPLYQIASKTLSNLGWSLDALSPNLENPDEPTMTFTKRINVVE